MVGDDQIAAPEGPQIVTPRAGAGYRSVTWVGHSTVLLQLGGLNVLTDPIWSERASPLRWLGPRRLMSPAVDFDALPAIDLVGVALVYAPSRRYHHDRVVRAPVPATPRRRRHCRRAAGIHR